MAIKNLFLRFYCSIKKISPVLRRLFSFSFFVYIFFLPFEFVATIGSKSIIAIVGLVVCLIAILYALLNVKKINFKGLLYVGPFVLYVFVFMVSFFYTKDREWNLYFLKIYASNILFVICVTTLIKLNQKEVELSMVSLILSSLVSSFFIFFIYSDVGSGRRTIGIFNTYIDPNYLAGIMLLSLYSIAYFIKRYFSTKKILLLIIPALIIFVAMFLTGSRTFIIALGLSLLVIFSYLLFFQKKYLFVAISISVLIIAYLAFYSILPEGLKYRFSIPGMLGIWETENNVGRVAIWEKILPAFFKKPIFGWGGGSVFYLTTTFYGTRVEYHNIFIEALLELGAVGFLILTSYFVFFFIKSYRERKITQSLLLANALVYGFFLSAFTVKFFWLIIAYVGLLDVIDFKINNNIIRKDNHFELTI